MILEAEQQAAQRAEKAAAKAVATAAAKAAEEGAQKVIAELLGRLFARRVGRRPTTEEERSIVERAQAIGPGEVEDALLDLDGDALVRWLAEPMRR
ncbi:hypothetical protein WMF04_24670 [Sorangium sp. So ce260]